MRRSLAVATATLLIILSSTAVSQAASLHLVFPQQPEATVVQGQSVTVPLEVQAYGATRCSATTAPVRIDGLYSVDAVGDIAAGQPGDMPITTDKNRGSSDNCYIHNPVIVPLTVTAAFETAVGDYKTLVKYGKGGDGDVSEDGPPLTIHVIAPDSQPAPAIEQPLAPPPAILVLGDRETAPRPKLGQTLLLTLVKGKVGVRAPGQAVKALVKPLLVPNGTVIDASKGTVKVTVVRDKTGLLDSADAWGGGFKATQTVQNGRGLTTFTLVGELPVSTTGASAARSASKKFLWVNGKGNFKTKAKRASAIVRGTYWLTEETSSGSSKVTVKRGLVAVRDFVKHRTVLVSTGHSYEAKARTTISRRIPAFTGRVR